MGNARAVAVIRGAVLKAFGYDASFRHFPIVGICAQCAQLDAPTDVPAR